eukprot:Gregarina_sp_Poly_1__11138@NODE_902_length_5777_cov_93_573030_g644_i0_p1_GENE_NODE_902_length_5777_cov_93_573030_g644_i0NODE_902_length_5777_cov_93_573030_g644_i0_p1_ORF_typecomplete_len355_score46_14_NODE_902_length_5777_cov_93_573030_g644_i038564920
MPQVDSPLYEEHLKRSLWGALRAAVTKEKMGICVPEKVIEEYSMAAQSKTKQEDKSIPTEEAEIVPDQTRPLIVMREAVPIEFAMPSLLKKSIAASEYLPRSSMRGLSLLMGSLGDFQCFPVTKIGRHTDNKFITHSDLKESGAPLQGSFLIQYTPLISLAGDTSIDEQQSNHAFRLIAEPYEFVIPQAKLKQFSNDKSGGLPNRLVLHRLELQNIVSAISELAAVASLHASMNEPVDRLLAYLDVNHLRMLEPVVSMLKSSGARHPTLYMSFREVNNKIEMPAGTLPLVCDQLGEGSAQVEISAFLPHPTVIAALSALLWPSSRNTVSVTDFIRSVSATTLDQTICTIRVLCI